MKTFKEYAEERDINEVSLGALNTPMKHFGFAWDKIKDRNPERFANTYLQRSRLKTAGRGNLDPYLGLARTPGEVRSTSNILRNTLQQSQRDAIDKLKQRDLEQP